MFNLLKGFIKHEPIDRRHRRDNYSVSLCKSGCFGFPRAVVEKYNLTDKKSMVLYFNPKEPKKLVVGFQDKMTPGAVKLRFRYNGLGLATALSFIHGNPTYIGKYTVDDAQINAFNGDTFLSLVKQG